MAEAEPKGHVLVVDDDDESRNLTRIRLEAAGYHVSLAADGLEAIKAFENPDVIELVLLDVMMPKMNGFEACQRIRELDAGKDVPIVFLTALNDHETHERALSSGADDFLVKPINRVELLIRVRSLVRIVKLQQALRRERDTLLRVQSQKELLTTLLIHDLKNPLASILANGEFVLMSDVVKAGDEHDALDDIVVSSEAMRQMVMNLLDISRAEDGALVAQKSDVDVAELAANVEERARRRFKSANKRLTVSTSPKITTVSVDPILIGRVLDNLIDNCLKYAPERSTITLEVMPSLGEGSFDLVVRDEGNGVPLDQRQRIFDKYAQAEKIDGDRTSRGLGLVFCRMAAEVHGGTIAVEDNVASSRGGGALFRVTLPLVR